MAIEKSALLKLGAAKAWTLAFPLGLIVLGTIWVRRARAGLPTSAPRHRSATPGDEAEAVYDTTAAGGAVGHGKNPELAARGANTVKHKSSTPHGTDREALLSRIIDDNVRLRAALK